MAAVGINPVDVSSDSRHGSPSIEVSSGPDGSISSWVPGIQDIRAAHLAQASALESVVASLAAKHQSSITALRCDLDALALTLKTARAAQQRGVAAPTAQATGNAQVTDPARAAKIGQAADVAGARRIGETTPTSVGDVTDEMLVTKHTGASGPADKDLTVVSSVGGLAAPSWETLNDYQPPSSENKEPQWQQAQEMNFMACRVAALEKDVVKLQGMWDINKGQRVIEVWMSLLNKKSYKPLDCDDPVECAVITLQNWWRDMLQKSFDGSFSGSSEGSSTGSEGSTADVERNNTPESVPGSSGGEGDSSDACLEDGVSLELLRVPRGDMPRRPTVRQLCDIAEGINAHGDTRQRYSVASSSCDNIVHDEQPDSEADEEHSTGGAEEVSSASQPDLPEQTVPKSYDNADHNDGPSHEAHGKRPVEEREDSTDQPDLCREENAENGECEAPRSVDPRVSEDAPTPPLSQGASDSSNGNDPPVAKTSFPEDDSIRSNRRETHGRVKMRGWVGEDKDTAPGRNQRGYRPSQSMETRPSNSGTKGTGSKKRHSSVPGGVASPRTAAGSVGATRGARRKRSQVKPDNNIARNGGEEEAAEETLDSDVFDRAEEQREHGTSPVHHKHGHITSHHSKSSPISSRRHVREHGGRHSARQEPEGGGGVQHMFDGAVGGNPVLMMTSIAMQLQSLEAEVENLQEQVESSMRIQHQKDRQQQVEELRYEKQKKHSGGDTHLAQTEELQEMGRKMGELQRELHSLREREHERDRKNEVSLETLEALIAEASEESARSIRAQAKENAAAIDKILKELGDQALKDKSEVVRLPLVSLKLELRSMYSSLAAISGNEVSASILRGLEGIRHLLTSVAERARDLEDQIGDPATLARSIVAEDLVARRFADHATELGTTIYALIKAQVLQAKRAHEAKKRESIDGVNVDGIASRRSDDGSAGTSAPPEAWAKLASLMYTRDATGEQIPFPAGLAGLLKAISDVLNHCVATGDLAIRLSVTLEDLTLYVAQRSDKEREAVIRELSAPIDGTKAKLSEMEELLAGFQRTMHLVLGEVEADKERATAIKALGGKVNDLQTLFARVRGEIQSKASASEIEAALEDMTSKIQESANHQSRLQRLAHTLGKDKNSSAAMKRLQIELEQARSMAVLAMAPSNNEVLIGSKCLSCNRPLGGFAMQPVPKPPEEWYTGAGSLGGPRDRFMSPSMPSTGGSAGGTNSVGSSTDEMHSNGTAGGSGGGGAGGGIGTSKAPGQTQPVMTPGKIMPEGPASSPGKSGPLLFERAGGNAEVPAQGLKGRVLRGGGGPGTDGGVNVSKYPRLVPLTAPKSAPAKEKLYQTARNSSSSNSTGGGSGSTGRSSGGTGGGAPSTSAPPIRRRASSSSVSQKRAKSLLDSDDVSVAWNSG